MDTTHGPDNRLYVTVWLGLLAIVGIEVALTYAGLSRGALLSALLALACLEAALALGEDLGPLRKRALLQHAGQSLDLAVVQAREQADAPQELWRSRHEGRV